MSTKVKLLVKSSLFQVTQSSVTIAIGFFMMPFLLSSLGKEAYGLWITIGSIVGSYHLLDLGFNQAVTRYVVKYIHRDDNDGANRIINSALCIYTILGLMVLFISMAASLFFADKLMENQEHLSLAKIVLIVSGVSIAFEFPAKSFPGIISAYMRFDVIASIRFVKNILDALLFYVVIKNGYGIVGLALVTLLTGIISTIVYVKYSTFLFKNLKFSFAYVDKVTIKKVFHFSKWVFLFDLSSLLRDKFDIWLISYFMGLSVLPTYYVAVRLTDYSLHFLRQLTNFTGPVFTEYYSKRENELLTSSLSIFIKINFFTGILILVGFYYTGLPFIGLWMGDEINPETAQTCLMILAVGRFMTHFTSPLQSMLMTINKHKIGAVIALLETVASVLLGVYLVPHYGLVGACISVTIPYVLGRAILYPAITFRYIYNWIDGKIIIRLTTFLLGILLSSYILTTMIVAYTSFSSLNKIFVLGVTVIFCSLLSVVFLLTRPEIYQLRKLIFK